MTATKVTISFSLLLTLIASRAQYYFCVHSCLSGELFLDGKCFCQQQQYVIHGKCAQCPPGTVYNDFKSECTPVCDQHSVYRDGRCFCEHGYYSFGKKCLKCPQGTEYVASEQTCRITCDSSQYWTPKGCVCKYGKQRVNGICQQCPKTMIYDDKLGKCRCEDQNVWNTMSKICVPKCGINQEYIDSSCECKNGYNRIKGVCGVCGQGSYYFAGGEECICGFGFIHENGKCIPNCTDREFYDPNKGKCVPYCAQFTEVWNDYGCQCAEGFIRDPVTSTCYPSCGPFQIRKRGVCQCISGYYKGVFSPSCIPISCPPGHEWNPKRRQCRSICPGQSEVMLNGVCVCIEGYSREDTQGVCLPNCPGGQIRINGKCDCARGNKFVNGRCSNCPPNTQYVNGVCLCYNGKVPFNGRCQFLSCPDKNHVFDPISNSCKCRKPLVWMLGRCQYMEQCGQHQYWSGSSCVCKNGYVKKYGHCVPADEVKPECPKNSVFNGVNCQCLPGLFPITPLICGKCPSNCHWNGWKCEIGHHKCAPDFKWDVQRNKCVPSHGCRQNQYHDGFHCRCKKGFFWIDGKCQTCPYGTFFDGLRCAGVEVPTCDDSYKFWNGKECVCMDGFFEVGDTCVQCPESTNWNGVCCKLKRGGQIDFTVASYD